MNVLIFDEQSSLNISKVHVDTLVRHVLSLESIQTQEVMVHFVMKGRICDLHSKFFNDPSPTDCISFPIDENTLGEVFVCTDIAIEYAEEHNLNPKDEAALYVVHGLLHLMGYDDIEEKDQRMMQKKEKSCMQSLRKHHLGIDSDHFKNDAEN